MLTIVGIPFGYECFKLSILALFPFEQQLNPRIDVDGIRLVMNVLWLFLLGWEAFLLHLSFALVFAVTIIGFPFAMQHWKLAKLSLWPFGQHIGEEGMEQIP
ncbi:DUF307-domain-containing protein [Basidiobolus meristosporus CBS 931.73]|uniref:DUF307-domain-containing protein n=1 Tax=Basidiobolus meristosporus CBS 931.73 TaxID=1314790 RepID=A0A1Y1YXD1_9FUNG|nr:DUF307-domain-containing protein [Basidiobolus meristosporus CBS 931.73]|eukprot:ORY02649.1 DUF307-domain-containing protein [Basidiobolus meristosporus CBS 931.73]